MKLIFLMALLLLISGCQNISRNEITTFEECVRAGNPVMETYPRQCNHKGQTFVEEISSESEVIRYSSKDPKECSRIQALLQPCEPSFESFSDDTGCGCRKMAERDDLQENYCTPESREADACITLYDPVCGWNDPEKIQCIKYPCAQTYSNSCFACMDKNVLYWTEGECPN